MAMPAVWSEFARECLAIRIDRKLRYAARAAELRAAE
jgi:hypothetical protein